MSRNLLELQEIPDNNWKSVYFADIYWISRISGEKCETPNPMHISTFLENSRYAWSRSTSRLRVHGGAKGNDAQISYRNTIQNTIPQIFWADAFAFETAEHRLFPRGERQDLTHGLARKKQKLWRKRRADVENMKKFTRQRADAVRVCNQAVRNEPPNECIRCRCARPLKAARAWKKMRLARHSCKCNVFVVLQENLSKCLAGEPQSSTAYLKSGREGERGRSTESVRNVRPLQVLRKAQYD